MPCRQPVHIHYAIKANPMPELVKHLSSLVYGLDVASRGELEVALNTDTDVRDISFAGPGKTEADLRAAVDAGVTINVESFGEIERLSAIGEAVGVQPSVAIRVNPDFELRTSGMKMSGGSKQFGIDAELVPQAMDFVRERDLKFRGFHIFSGSQNLRTEALIEAQSKTVELVLSLAKTTTVPLELVNIGGGFGIPYFPGESCLDIKPIADNLEELLPRIAENLGEPEIVIELGRYLVGEAGLYVCRVIDKKVSRGHTFLVTDGGLHHHLAASGNFGQVLRKNYPVAIANRMNGAPLEAVSIVGPLCTPLDLLADNVQLPTALPGDLVAIFQSGAYGYSASPLNFLSHPEPAEILV